MSRKQNRLYYKCAVFMIKLRIKPVLTWNQNLQITENTKLRIFITYLHNHLHLIESNNFENVTDGMHLLYIRKLSCKSFIIYTLPMKYLKVSTLRSFVRGIFGVSKIFDEVKQQINKIKVCRSISLDP